MGSKHLFIYYYLLHLVFNFLIDLEPETYETQSIYNCFGITVYVFYICYRIVDFFTTAININ